MKLRCFGCGHAISNELPPDTIVHGLILCRKCVGKAVVQIDWQDKGWSKTLQEKAPLAAAYLEPPPAPAAPIPVEAASEFLRTRAAADLLGVKPTTLEAWRLRGGGPRYVKVSRRVVMYRRSELLEWMQQREVASTAEQW